MLFSTRCNGHLNFKDTEHQMTKAQQAMGSFIVANKGKLSLGLTGKLAMIMVNTAHHPNIPEHQSLEIDTTTVDVRCELFSFDPLYRDGWGCDIRPVDRKGDKSACLYKIAEASTVRIPLIYD
jgi:hypothetical protein